MSREAESSWEKSVDDRFVDLDDAYLLLEKRLEVLEGYVSDGGEGELKPVTQRSCYEQDIIDLLASSPATKKCADLYVFSQDLPQLIKMWRAWRDEKEAE